MGMIDFLKGQVCEMGLAKVALLMLRDLTLLFLIIAVAWIALTGALLK
ncbi:MAG: hypothetical protein ABSE05_17225 [Syntrophales bacterium]|jgi:hypothetical protein